MADPTLSVAQTEVLRRGYCILHMDHLDDFMCSDLTYDEWEMMTDLGMIEHQHSRLHPDDNPNICLERYRVTKIGRMVYRHYTEERVW